MILTINDLFNYCEAQKKLGNGNKKILISTDDEGNVYHPLYYAFAPLDENYDKYCDVTIEIDDVTDYFTLG